MAEMELGAVGNAARASKASTRVPQELTSFSVRRGDNGGVVVSESYTSKVPEGRRASSFPGGTDYKENPFSSDDGAAAQAHIEGLLSQMGVAKPEAAGVAGPLGSVSGMRGPAGATAQVTGPAGNSVRAVAPAGGL